MKSEASSELRGWRDFFLAVNKRAPFLLVRYRLGKTPKLGFQKADLIFNISLRKGHPVYLLIKERFTQGVALFTVMEKEGRSHC